MDHCPGMPHDAGEHCIREDPRHLGDVSGVEGGLLAPPPLSLGQRMPLEQASIEVPKAIVKLRFRPADPLEPPISVRPVRDLLGGDESPHESGLVTDRDVWMSVQDKPEQSAAR